MNGDILTSVFDENTPHHLVIDSYGHFQSELETSLRSHRSTIRPVVVNYTLTETKPLFEISKDIAFLVLAKVDDISQHDKLQRAHKAQHEVFKAITQSTNTIVLLKLVNEAINSVLKKSSKLIVQICTGELEIQDNVYNWLWQFYQLPIEKQLITICVCPLDSDTTIRPPTWNYKLVAAQQGVNFKEYDDVDQIESLSEIIYCEYQYTSMETIEKFDALIEPYNNEYLYELMFIALIPFPLLKRKFTHLTGKLRQIEHNFGTNSTSPDNSTVTESHPQSTVRTLRAVTGSLFPDLDEILDTVINNDGVTQNRFINDGFFDNFQCHLETLQTESPGNPRFLDTTSSVIGFLDNYNIGSLQGLRKSQFILANVLFTQSVEVIHYAQKYINTENSDFDSGEERAQTRARMVSLGRSLLHTVQAIASYRTKLSEDLSALDIASNLEQVVEPIRVRATEYRLNAIFRSMNNAVIRKSNDSLKKFDESVEYFYLCYADTFFKKVNLEISKVVLENIQEDFQFLKEKISKGLKRQKRLRKNLSPNYRKLFGTGKQENNYDELYTIRFDSSEDGDNWMHSSRYIKNLAHSVFTYSTFDTHADEIVRSLSPTQQQLEDIEYNILNSQNKYFREAELDEYVSNQVNRIFQHNYKRKQTTIYRDLLNYLFSSSPINTPLGEQNLTYELFKNAIGNLKVNEITEIDALSDREFRREFRQTISIQKNDIDNLIKRNRFFEESRAFLEQSLQIGRQDEIDSFFQKAHESGFFSFDTYEHLQVTRIQKSEELASFLNQNIGDQQTSEKLFYTIFSAKERTKTLTDKYRVLEILGYTSSRFGPVHTIDESPKISDTSPKLRIASSCEEDVPSLRVTFKHTLEQLGNGTESKFLDQHYQYVFTRAMEQLPDFDTLLYNSTVRDQTLKQRFWEVAELIGNSKADVIENRNQKNVCFICHASSDGTHIANHIEEQLKGKRFSALDLTPFVDKTFIDGGVDWKSNINTALQRSKLFIVIVSEASLTQHLAGKYWIKFFEAPTIADRVRKETAKILFVVQEKIKDDSRLEEMIERIFGKQLKQHFIDIQRFDAIEPFDDNTPILPYQTLETALKSTCK